MLLAFCSLRAFWVSLLSAALCLRTTTIEGLFSLVIAMRNSASMQMREVEELADGQGKGEQQTQTHPGGIWGSYA